jgi:hypothetical protein
MQFDQFEQAAAIASAMLRQCEFMKQGVYRSQTRLDALELGQVGVLPLAQPQ